MKNEGLAIVAWPILLVMLLISGTTLAQEDKVTHGAELLAPLKIELKQALIAGMQDGPLNAISVCKDQAPEIAKSLSIEGIEMGRTSHRLRNPANAAPDWVSPVLKAYLGEDPNRAPRVASLPDNREGYVEPIMIKPLCLACHGSALAPEVAAHLSEAYPEDEATGFDVGDLRGVYWVEYPVAE